MNILVTGGAGFIGSHIAEYFADAGHNVTILDNLSTGYSHNIPMSDNITVMKGDICVQATVAKATKGVDYVFHHAALVSIPLSCQRPADAFNINIFIRNSIKLIINKFTKFLRNSRFFYISFNKWTL